ncbi:MAG TPA: folylpolyglutamate synthase/dihydrofolate synthase family protein [Opitutaceae bacterium]|nr:folylpolyglutamate synthase/dihydrofolate synthase family protein [Opitutaceae bacterium]
MLKSEPLEISATIDFLFAQKPVGAKFGVDRMRTLSAALGNPERRVPCVHVAGTNGKGSVSAMLEAILRGAGWRTGLYTSPHLVEVGERVQVDRHPLTREQVAAYVGELRPAADRLAAADPDFRPSFFEYMTAMAFLEFGRRRCDIAVYEVGLGGRLDATNIVSPEVSVITSIGLDHCEYLGSDLGQIAAEKAGIIKPGVPVVVGRMPAEAEEVIRGAAGAAGAPVHSVREEFRPGTLPVTSLGGEYQRWNAATATLVARTLDARWRLSPEIIREGLRHVQWSGRWETIPCGGRTLILDASHNPEGAEALDENLTRLRAETGVRPIVVTGVLGADRARALLATISRHAREIHLVVPNQERACGYEQLEQLVPDSFSGPVIRDTVEHLFPGGGACQAGAPDDIVVVTGSIYLLGEILGRVRP